MDKNATGCDGPKTLVGYGDYVALCGESKKRSEIKDIATNMGDDDKVKVFDYKDNQFWWMVNTNDYDGDNIEIFY